MTAKYYCPICARVPVTSPTIPARHKKTTTSLPNKEPLEKARTEDAGNGRKNRKARRELIRQIRLVEPPKDCYRRKSTYAAKDCANENQWHITITGAATCVERPPNNQAQATRPMTECSKATGHSDPADVVPNPGRFGHPYPLSLARSYAGERAPAPGVSAHPDALLDSRFPTRSTSSGPGGMVCGATTGAPGAGSRRRFPGRWD